MIDDVSDISAFYNLDPEREHSRLERHQLERDLTWRYLDEYLPSRARILEIGSATGRYTVALARRGHQVTAVDLSEKLLELCKARVAEAGLDGQVKFILADVRDLQDVGEKEFDIVLLMGPLYHLVIEADRIAALKQVHRCLKKDGILFSSFISRFGIMGDLLKNVPDWVEDQDEVQAILTEGRDPKHFRSGGFRGYFANVSEIASLHEPIGFETLTLAGVEPAISADDESYNKLEGTQRQLWLDLLYQVSTEPSIMGASRHLLYVGKKK
jgi:SAM-dependent methyltransferase